MRRAREATLEDRSLFTLLRGLTTEARNPRTRDIDQMDSVTVLRAIHAEDRGVLDAVQAVIPAWGVVVDRVVGAFRSGGRLFYAGAGTSGRLGVLDAAECPPTYGTDPSLVVGLIAGGHATLVRSAEGVEDREEDGVRDVDEAGISAHDVLVGISASRRTPYVRAALRRARERGAWTAFLVGNALDEDPRGVADHVVEVVTGPEAVTGSTRMKAALAQKMMLTMLTTAAMVRWGKTYENLMVDVAPTSRKLVERAKGLVMLLGGVSYERATELLDCTGYRVKTAVIIARTGVDPARAEAWLEETRGHLRDALARAGVTLGPLDEGTEAPQ